MEKNIVDRSYDILMGKTDYTINCYGRYTSEPFIEMLKSVKCQFKVDAIALGEKWLKE